MAEEATARHSYPYPASHEYVNTYSAPSKSYKLHADTKVVFRLCNPRAHTLYPQAAERDALRAAALDAAAVAEEATARAATEGARPLIREYLFNT